MGKSLISNPPYNMKWDVPQLAGLLPLYEGHTIPPKSNANFAFILSGLSKVDGKAAFLLPNSVLTTENPAEVAIRKELVEQNLLEAVLLLPSNMFESTSIATCILVFNNRKKTQKTVMLDLREQYQTEQRDQNGQCGGTSHTNRTYHKAVNVLSEATMDRAVKVIAEMESIPGFSTVVSLEKIRKADYILTPSRYIELQQEEAAHRPFADIAADYDRVVRQKNAIHLTINETAARRLGLPVELYRSAEKTDLSAAFECVGEKVEKENHIHFSKSDGIQIKCSTKEDIPILVQDFIRSWTQYERYLNEEENRYLAEFRDALLPELMSGHIKL